MAEYRDLLNRIKEGEGLHLDFKHCISDSKKIARSLVAYANTEGGCLLIGVRDNGSIAGISSEEEYYMIETAAVLYTKPVVEFSTIEHNIQGKIVLEIIVEKSDNRPHYAPDASGQMKAYVRSADKNIVAPKIILDVWKNQKKNISGVKIIYDEIVELILNEIKINGFVTKPFVTRLTGIKSSRADKIFSNLMLMKIIDAEVTEKSVNFVFHKDYSEIMYNNL